MATILEASVTDKVSTLVLDDATGLVVGEHVHVYGTGNPHIDGHHNLASVNLATDTVTYPTGGPDVPVFEPAGAILVAQITWIDAADAQEFLGTVDDPDELTYLESCVDAANEFAYQRRRAAGYNDSPVIVPNSAARMGTILYASALFREKGSIDSYQSFQDLPVVAPVGSMGQVLRLLGVNRPAIG